MKRLLIIENELDRASIQQNSQLAEDFDDVIDCWDQRLQLIDVSEWKFLSISGLLIDLDRRQVYKGDKAIHLTPQEFKMLTFLVKHPNRVFSKYDLFDQIWNVGGYGSVSTVAVHIKAIRDKIEDVPSNPTIIETVRGFGYRFNEV